MEAQEFGIFSHAGTDGPIGSKSTSKNPLFKAGDLNPAGETYTHTSTQMSIKRWRDIDFNWIKDGKSRANFYGCNTGVDPDGDGPRQSFTTTLSGLANFKDVNVGGQSSSSYPSMFTNVRETNAAMRSGEFNGLRTYLVGAPPLGLTGRWSSTTANPMILSKDGETIKPFYQVGTQK